MDHLMDSFFSSSTLLLCIAVFFSRILDVSFGTLRMVNVVRGNSLAAMGMGFCETFIWFVIAREALQSASGLAVGAAYAGGYATGTLLGTLISKRITRSRVEAHVITSHHDPSIVEALRQEGYGVTAVELCATRDGEKRYMLLISMDAKDLSRFHGLLETLDEHAFVTVSEMKTSYNGYFRMTGSVK